MDKANLEFWELNDQELSDVQGGLLPPAVLGGAALAYGAFVVGAAAVSFGSDFIHHLPDSGAHYKNLSQRPAPCGPHLATRRQG